MESVIAPLFVPADRRDRFVKAARSGADAIIVDLEDAVSPDVKDSARANLSGLSDLPVPVIVRINAEKTRWHDDDIAAASHFGLRQLCVPKVETTDTLDRLTASLGGQVTFLVQIETAAGLENISAIAGHTGVCQLAFGPADFFLDLGMTPSEAMSTYALCRMAVASRTAGIAKPLDGPSFAIGDPDALSLSCEAALAAGAGGKLCIHPSQPAQVLRAFQPDPAQVAWARRVVEATGGGRAQQLDGKMVDAPVVAWARTIIERSRPS